MSHSTILLAMPCRLLAFIAILSCPSLWAAEIGDAARSNSISAPQAEIAWISGGIGDEALAEMRKNAGNYNVHLMFSGRQGHYLSDIPYTIARQDGRTIHEGISAGPLVYLKLPPGTYQVTADLNGTKQSKRIRAGNPGRAAKLSFVAND